MNPGIACTRGRYLPVQDAAIPILDWGFLHSDAGHDAADEIFGSSSAGGILSICHLEGRHVGVESAEDVTQMLSRAYWRRHEDSAYRQLVGLLTSSPGGATSRVSAQRGHSQPAR